MRKSLLFLSATAVVLYLSGCSRVPEEKVEQAKVEEWQEEWQTDYTNAVETAKQEGKYLLLNFSGSDWCGWCIRLEDEVFSKSEFKTYAADRLVCVTLDFPRSKVLSEDEQEQNQQLAQKHQVQGFPTVLLLNPDETIIGKTGYRQGGPQAYAEHLEEMIAAYEAEHGKLKAQAKPSSDTGR